MCTLYTHRRIHRCRAVVPGGPGWRRSRRHRRHRRRHGDSRARPAAPPRFNKQFLGG